VILLSVECFYKKQSQWAASRASMVSCPNFSEGEPGEAVESFSSESL